MQISCAGISDRIISIIIRGGGSEYNQSHKKVIDQTEAAGHAVRATYMYSGMADVAALTGEPSYIHAIDAIWEDIVYRKFYITGGIGAIAGHEGFGPPFDLPNMSAYNETCASIGSIYWNWRLFLLHGESKYYDVLERILYNGMISGVSLTGDHFFYPNPLESAGQHERSAWFGCACCPSNVCRFIPSMPGYVYAIRQDRLYVNLYVQSTAQIMINQGAVELVQETDYPWDGEIRFHVNPKKSDTFEIALRIPGWAQNQAVPGDLYRFTDESMDSFEVHINGKRYPCRLENGYALLNRKWKKKDLVLLSLPMPVRRVAADARVDQDRNRTAIQRGPIVYCAEWPDADDGRVLNFLLQKNDPLICSYQPELLEGIGLIRGTAGKLNRMDGKIIESNAQLRMIPYYAWANRGAGEMAVWIADTASAIWLPEPTIASKSQILASIMTKTLLALNDLREPTSSNDHSVPIYDWWPMKDTTQWVGYVFEKPERISSVQVYWFDDGPWGGCRVPDSWKLFYRDVSGDWHEPAIRSSYGIEKDKFNRLDFDFVVTDALKLEVRLSKTHSGGILEWTVE
jgi:DUF1680 family protein